jgi:outer membrane protein OmpA-like peptidoglycan-associated protein
MIPHHLKSKKHFLLCSLLTLGICSPLHARAQRTDTFKVFFDLNNARITKDAEDHIDKLIFKDKLIHGDKLIILGYADYLGDNHYNDALSAQRASNVRDYLVKSGFRKEDITICIGKGKIDRALAPDKKGFAADRKVQIIIDRSVAVKPQPATPPKVTPPTPTAKTVKKIVDLKVNETVALNNINFYPGMNIILPESMPEVENLYEVLNEHKNIRIRIEGHVCCLGPIEGYDGADSTSGLSYHRAKAIYELLVTKGIHEDRIQYIGLGNMNPVVKEDRTEEDHIKNRRVEIRIISK